MSNIIHSTIDASYPVAGIDNDTQGFRDNFQIIKDGLSTAYSEIGTLETNTAKLNATNDFNGTNITDANFNLNTDQYHSIGTVINNQNISFLNGRYQILTMNPAGTSIQFTRLTEGGGTIKAPSSFLRPFALNTGVFADDPAIINFWTYNSGTTVYANYLGKFYDL
jgi:hypothetical protein